MPILLMLLGALFTSSCALPSDGWPNTVPEMNSILLMLLGAVLTFVTTWFWRAKTKAEEATKETLKRVADLEKQLSLVNQAIVPISAAFQAILVKELTHYHAPRTDELLAKLGPPCELTEEEEEELNKLLRERTADMGDEITESERDAAAMMPFLMRRARRECNISAGLLKPKVVGVDRREKSRDEE